MNPDATRNLTTKIVAIGLISLFANTGLTACSRTPGNSNKETTSEIKIVDVSNDEMDHAAVAGGWKTAEDQKINDAQRKIFDKAMEKLVGVKYEPIAYLASQIVSGTNHCFLCKATVVRPGAAPTYTLVYIYENLSRECTILNIENLDLPGKSGTLGGFTVAEDPTITPEIASALDKASKTKLGASYEPVANIGSQVINGTNHVVLCKVTATAPGAQSSFALVQVAEMVNGECSIGDVKDIVISANK